MSVGEKDSPVVESFLFYGVYLGRVPYNRMVKTDSQNEMTAIEAVYAG